MTNHAPIDDRPTVLVIEDERTVADLYAQILSPTYRVHTAYGGQEALETIDDAVDVVLLDRRMPDMHGDEVLAEIRARDLDCRVVMVTAIDPDVDVIGLDFDDYLVKPVDGTTLLNAVEQMLRRKELDAELLDAFALASKMATLESKMDPEDLEQSPEYAELEARFAEYRERMKEIDPNDDLYADLSALKMHALFAG